MGYNAIIAIILQLTSRAASANPFPWSANRIESARKKIKSETIFSIFVFVLLLVCVSFGSFIHSLFSIVYSLGRNRKRGDNAMELLAAKCFFSCEFILILLCVRIILRRSIDNKNVVVGCLRHYSHFRQKDVGSGRMAAAVGRMAEVLRCA